MGGGRYRTGRGLNTCGNSGLWTVGAMTLRSNNPGHQDEVLQQAKAKLEAANNASERRVFKHEWEFWTHRSTTAV